VVLEYWKYINDKEMQVDHQRELRISCPRSRINGVFVPPGPYQQGDHDKSQNLCATGY
jgi:hypothetical protein